MVGIAVTLTQEKLINIIPRWAATNHELTLNSIFQKMGGKFMAPPDFDACRRHHHGNGKTLQAKENRIGILGGRGNPGRWAALYLAHDIPASVTRRLGNGLEASTPVCAARLHADLNQGVSLVRPRNVASHSLLLFGGTSNLFLVFRTSRRFTEFS